MRKGLLFLSILNDADVDWMIASGTRQELASGDVLIHEGSPIESLFMVLEGSLAVRTAARGEKEIARLVCGEIVGEISFVDEGLPSASVSALETSTVLMIPRASLVEKLESDVEFAARFYRAVAVFLSDRLRATIGLLGYGEGAQTEGAETDPAILDALALACARFDTLQRSRTLDRDRDPRLD